MQRDLCYDGAGLKRMSASSEGDSLTLRLTWQPPTPQSSWDHCKPA